MADVIEWVPGFIESDPDMCFGEPHLVGTRLPVGSAYSAYQDPKAYDVGTLQSLILYAFARGADWQRSKHRRKSATSANGGP